VALIDRLIGTFRLVSLEVRRSDGRVDHPMGDQPAGLFILGRDGHYSVQLSPGRTSGGSAPVPPGYGYVATWGTYAVDEERQTFTLTPAGALDDALIGVPIRRHVTFVDDVAVFNTSPQIVDGVETTTYITWRKEVPPPEA
jgi:hypothetical protein